ncbi:MAG: hypothetical protein WDN48_02235, partial [Pseudolabrys sp.]
MAGFFSEPDIVELNHAKDDLHVKFGALKDKLVARSYKSDRGRAYTFEGLIRRLDTMIRAIDYVFEILPPQLEDTPTIDDTVIATILIQSFVINVQGCLDNLAWIWVYETFQKDKWGHELDRRMVGIGEGYWFLRRSFSKPFRTYLKSQKKWFRHVAEFRDTLAHRIPLYVLPFIVSGPNMDEYNRLQAEAFATHDYKTYLELKTRQDKLGAYRPWMTHSPIEGAPLAVFHKQMLQDFLTIDECANKIFAEIDSYEPNKRTHPLVDQLFRAISRFYGFVVRTISAFCPRRWGPWQC